MRKIWRIVSLTTIIAASTTLISCTTAQPPNIIPPTPITAPPRPDYPTLTPAELAHLTELAKGDKLFKSALDKISRKDQMCRGYAKKMRRAIEQTRAPP